MDLITFALLDKRIKNLDVDRLEHVFATLTLAINDDGELIMTYDDGRSD